MTCKCQPQDDFDCYYNHSWKDRHKGENLNSFDQVSNQVYTEILGYVGDTDYNSQSKIGLNMMSFIDSFQDRLGCKNYPVFFKPIIDRIMAINDVKTMAIECAYLVQIGVSNFCNPGISITNEANSELALNIEEPNLLLDNKENYYLEDNSENRQNYMIMLGKMYEFIEVECECQLEIEPETFIEDVVVMETMLSNLVLTLEEFHNPSTIYNLTSRNGFVEEYDSHNFWSIVLTELFGNKKFVVRFPNKNYLEHFKRLIDKASTDPKLLSQIKNYLVYCLMLEYGLYTPLGQSIIDLTRTRVNCLDSFLLLKAVTENFGFYLRERFSRTNVDEKRDDYVREMFREIIAYCSDRFEANTFFQPETKRHAIAKVGKIELDLGSDLGMYQDILAWLETAPKMGSNFFVNLCKLETFQFDKIKTYPGLKGTKRQLFHFIRNMSVSFDANAYYEPESNIIHIPTTVLQSKFFLNISDSMAFNYGGLGTMLGHEIMHSFDNQGSLYDQDGYFKEWWTQADREIFDLKSQKVVDYYSQIKIKGQTVNGVSTLGENMADIVGTRIALGAFLKLAFHKTTGFDDDQKREIRLFFKRFAIQFRSSQTVDDIVQQLRQDVHSPLAVRVNGTVAHIDTYYEIFDVKPTDCNYLKPELRYELLN